MMKKFFTAALAAAMMLTLAACGPKAPAESSASDPAGSGSTSNAVESVDGAVMAKIKNSGKLVVGTEAQYAPYEFKDMNADFAGCDIWLAQQIADSMGVELEIVDMAFDGIIPAVQSGQVDMGIAAFSWTAERAEEIDFSNVYEKSPQAIVVKKGNEALYSTKEAFAGQKMGSQKGTLQSQIIKNVFTDSELFELDKYPELGMEVAAGNIAGLVVDSAVADALINSNDQLALAQYTFTEDEANAGKCIVMCKGNEDLVEAANVVVDQVVADGSFEAAYEEAVALADSLGIE